MQQHIIKGKLGKGAARMRVEMGMGGWKRGCTARIHPRACLHAAQMANKQLCMCGEVKRLEVVLDLFLFFTKSSKTRSQKLL